MMMSCFTIVAISFAVLSSLIIADDPCVFNDVKGTIDLSSLGRTDGKATYADRQPPTTTGYKFSYNPCKPFTEGTVCINVAACQVSTDGQLNFIIGTQDSAKWSSGPGLGSTPSVTYSAGQKQTIVSLICSTDPAEEQFEALGESPREVYKFRLTHKCACWDGCKNTPQTTTKSPSGGGGGIAGGVVFIIILIVPTFSYFVGFALFYRFHQQKSGIELIPHRTFWVALPGYARDGVVYVYRRVSSKGGTPYQSV